MLSREKIVDNPVFAGKMGTVQGGVFSYNSPGLILSGVLFFLCFLNIQLKSSFINRMAASVLPVYLLHENKFLSHYLYDFVGLLKSYIPQPAALMFVMLILGIVLVIVCILIDKALSPVITRVAEAVTSAKYFKKIDQAFNHVLARITNSALRKAG